MPTARFHSIAIGAVLFASVAAAQAPAFRPEAFRTRATFDLAVESSPVLPKGATHLAMQGAYVAAVRGLAPGNSDGIEIHFFAQPIDAAGQDDILRNQARRLKKERYGALVLFLDKERKPWQVNLSYVVPGATVVRTVAWKPSELAPWAAGFRYDGRRVVLKTQGRFSETGQESFTLRWDVDLDLPVLLEQRR